MRLSRLLPLLSISLLPVLPAAAIDRSADDYFHSGAQSYITNNLALAKQFCTNGLVRYPNDEKLLKLKQLLDQQQQQQNQQQQQQQQEQQQKDQQQQQNQQNQQKKDQQKSGQQKQDDQKQQDQQKQKQDQDKQQKQDQQKSDADKKDDQKDKQDQADQPDQPVPGQMSKDEAKRLLDSQKDSEQLLQMKPKNRPRDPNRPVKDW